MYEQVQFYYPSPFNRGCPDPDEISDKATFEAPHQYSVGIRFLLINGEVVIEEGSYNGKLTGKPRRMNKK